MKDHGTDAAWPVSDAWLAIQDAVEDGLRRVLSDPPSALSEATSRLALSGGKRLRARLVIASGRAADSDDAFKHATDRLIDACVAIELLHAGSLVHDDLLDEASERRGVKTINAQEGSGWAILAGDMMLARAARVASSLGRPEACHFAELLDSLCAGQADETATAGDWTRSRPAYVSAAIGKTASLIAGACRFGAMQVGASPKVLDGLAGFGRAFGLAFQILDDVADIVLSTDVLGKPAMQDVREGIATFPIIVALERTDGLRRLLEVRPSSPEALAEVRRVIIESGAIDEAVEYALGLAGDAGDALGVLNGVGDPRPLHALLDDHVTQLSTVLEPAV